MNKKIIIGIISGTVLLALAIVGGIFIFANNNSNEPAPTETQAVPEPIVSPGAEPSTPSASQDPNEEAPLSEAFWSGKSKAGLCEAMQPWYVDEVYPHVYSSSQYGELEEQLGKAVDNGRQIISEHPDDESVELLTELVDSVEDYKNIVPKPESPQQQVGIAIGNQTEVALAVKGECNW